MTQARTATDMHIGLWLFVIAIIAVAAFAIHGRPSKPPHTPRPPAGPTNIRPATNAPHR